MHGTLLHGGMNHPWQAEIHPEDRRPIDLRGQLDSRERLAEQLPFAFRFDARLRGRLDLRRFIRDVAELQTAPGLFVNDKAFVRVAFFRFDAPAVGSRRHEHLAPRRAHRSQ